MASPAFLPARLLPATRLLRRAVLPRRSLCATAAQPRQATESSPAQGEKPLSARVRRRALEEARIQAHRAVAAELAAAAPGALRAVVACVPRAAVSRLRLPSRLARARLHLPATAVETGGAALKAAVSDALHRLYPDLSARGLFTRDQDFDVCVAAAAAPPAATAGAGEASSAAPQQQPLYVRVVPHNLPPAARPPSARMRRVRDAARAAAADAAARLAMLSFYKFVELPDAPGVATALQKAWQRMGVTGRVYVAREGVNAQLAVPASVLDDFKDAMSGAWTEHGRALVPAPLLGVFLNVDRVVSRDEQPFAKLHVRPREKILADGLDRPLDWSKAGREVSPQEWHDLVSLKETDTDSASDSDSDPESDSSDAAAARQRPVVLDCRNDYESDVGRFDGAEPLNTQVFRDSWGALDERLKGASRDTPILTYCTGGIRCVKVNAYLEQELGFTNVGRLAGGIVSYARHMRDQGRLDHSAFKGVNHVFDGRMGEIITPDLLDSCVSCGVPCNVQTDCANEACPRPFEKRVFVQCADCAAAMLGACCDSCRDVVVKSTNSPAVASSGPRQVVKSNATARADFAVQDVPNPAAVATENAHIAQTSAPPTHNVVVPAVRDETASDRYADAFSVPEPPLLAELRERTCREMPGRAHMLSSHAQASLLRTLAQLSGARSVLELGTFTGYATLALASGLPSDGRVLSVDTDAEVQRIAADFIARDCDNGRKILLRLGRGDEVLRELVDTDQRFDFVFIDADKGGYRGYVQTLLDDGLLAVGGVLVCDNVLFRGEVAQLWERGDDDVAASVAELTRRRIRNVRNVRKTAQKLHDFNEYVRTERRLDQTVLPFRDGLTIARRVE